MAKILVIVSGGVVTEVLSDTKGIDLVLLDLDAEKEIEFNEDGNELSENEIQEKLRDMRSGLEIEKINPKYIIDLEHGKNSYEVFDEIYRANQ
jgi:hypothetical protein